MTPRERMQSLFRQGRCPEPVVCLHTWGRYPFAAQGVEHRYGRCGGEALADVYEGFMRAFPHDWLHVREELTPRKLWGTPPDATDPDEADPAARALARPPQTIADVDAVFRTLPALAREDVRRAGMYDHVAALSRRVGRDLMIFPNQGAPGSGFPGLSFEDELVLIHERPELVAHAVTLDCTRFLERAGAAHDQGADGYILSEGYAGACDLISPKLFRSVFLEPKRAFYRELRRLGMLGIGYFLGNVVPYLDTIAEMEVHGVMIEESKKGFTLDPASIRRALPRQIVLFGNLDSVLLLRGSQGEVREAVREQARALEHGAFAFINGSPICPGTSPGNLRVFLESAREQGAGR